MESAGRTFNFTSLARRLGTFIHRKVEDSSSEPFDIVFFGTVITLTAAGLIMVYSSGFVTALKDFNNSLFFVKKQLFSGIIGFALLLFFMKDRKSVV